MPQNSRDLSERQLLRRAKLRHLKNILLFLTFNFNAINIEKI